MFEEGTEQGRRREEVDDRGRVMRKDGRRNVTGGEVKQLNVDVQLLEKGRYGRGRKRVDGL